MAIGRTRDFAQNYLHGGNYVLAKSHVYVIFESPRIVIEMTRTERLFALAEHLRARRTGITAGELAQRFDVTVRTIHRDLTALRAANLPVSSERGRGGGFALDAHYTLPPVNISAREAASLLMLTQYA
jgi:predicted DNA-binding transcriptional regulator YafY